MSELWKTIQRHVGAVVDGDPGDETARKIAAKFGLTSAPPPPPVVSSGTNLADRAAAYLGKGIREISGPSSHPQILAWLKKTEELYPTDLTIDDSKYAWCGVFVGNMVLDARAANQTLPPPPEYFQAAAKWRNWGAQVNSKSTQRGDVVVLTRTGGHHVAIVSGITHDGLKVIGGNQSDALSIAEYPWSRVVAVRRG